MAYKWSIIAFSATFVWTLHDTCNSINRLTHLLLNQIKYFRSANFCALNKLPCPLISTTNACCFYLANAIQKDDKLIWAKNKIILNFALFWQYSLCLWSIVEMFALNRFLGPIRLRIQLFRKKNPKEKWSILRDLFNAFAWLCWLNIFDASFKYTWLSYVCAVIAFNYTICTFYTIYHYVPLFHSFEF